MVFLPFLRRNYKRNASSFVVDRSSGRIFVICQNLSEEQWMYTNNVLFCLENCDGSNDFGADVEKVELIWWYAIVFVWVWQNTLSLSRQNANEFGDVHESRDK